MSCKKVAVLVLADGTKFSGFSFGADVSVSGEVVVNTSMLGYPELLSDPLSCGQIVVLTYPLVGNYGVPPVDELSSERVQAAGLVVTDYSGDVEFSHWDAVGSLGEWLRENNVPAICGIDTRELAKHIREKGEMAGKILVEGTAAPSEAEPVKMGVSEPTTYGEGDLTVALLDTGVTATVINNLVRRGVKVLRLPWDTDLETVPFDGLMLVGTAGDPALVARSVRKVLDEGKPVFGVRGADLILALAAGGKITNLGHGHRGTNQPVIEVGTPHAMITTQNHVWAVDAPSLPKGWEVWYANLNDGSVEGIRREAGFARAVSFQPEASNRPVEEDRLYSEFVEAVKAVK